MKDGKPILEVLKAQIGRDPRVAWIGLLGVALGGACILVGMIRGFIVPPEGNLWETATFDGSVGIFLLTQALLAPEAGFTAKGQRRWAVATVLATLYAYGIETIQAIRGLDPRFSRIASPTDQILGGVFFLDALIIMALFIVLVWKFFRAESTPCRLAVRYAAAACLLSFGVGIAMSAINGRMLGSQGNLMPIHAAGFHGLQALPLVALLFTWGGASGAVARRWVHLAGLAWFAFCLAVLWQAGAGLAPLAPSPALLISLACFAVWGWAAAVGMRAWSQARAG